MNKSFMKNKNGKPRCAIFLSGSGTNAGKILEQYYSKEQHNWVPVLIVTDRPKTSSARVIAEEYSLPLLECPVASFYRAHGLDKVTLSTEEGRRVRELWTADLISRLEPYQLDFGILTGFVTLSNIAAVLPCLNVHPGDLTYEKNGQRYLVGLHTVPVELAILEGLNSLRSSVILVQPYTPGKIEVDGGHIFGISEPVPIDLHGHTLEELQAVFHARKSDAHIHGANKDLLFELAAYNQERLKFAGDHIVYPQVIEDFVAGNFAGDEHGGLLYRMSGSRSFVPVKTVEYHADGSKSPWHR